MKLRILAIVPVVLSVLIGTSSFAGEENVPSITAKQVIEQYINAIGGREAVSKLTTRTMKGILTNDLRDRKEPKFEEYPIEAISKLPNLRLFWEKKEGGDEISGFDGKQFWEATSKDTIIGTNEANLKFAWLQNPQNALHFEDYFPNLVCTGTSEIRGVECYSLVPDELDPLYYTLYFDVKTGLLKSLGWYWELRDWKEVDGVKVPFTVVADRKGGSTTYNFGEIIHNEPVSDDLFQLAQMK